MELKVAMHVAWLQPTGGFNRTFMELKEQLRKGARGQLRFQSHLYGIERRNVTGLCHSVLGFNRTFMELKVDIIEIVIKSDVFQSHLYGIESIHHEGQYIIIGGFNRTFMELKEVPI